MSDYRESVAPITPSSTFGEFLTWIIRQMAENDGNGCEFEIPGVENGKRVMLCFDITKEKVDP